MNFKIDKIEAYSLCIGCGLCESISKGRCRMRINEKGFFVPEIDSQFTRDEKEFLNKTCPAVNIKCTPKGLDEFGPVLEGIEAYATDPVIRFSAASGGAVTAICTALLKTGEVDGILQVGKKDNHYMYNELKVSCFPDDVLKCASSRYAPVTIFSQIFAILETNRQSTYAFVGKPCDIMTMKRIIKMIPQYEPRIKYFIAITCAGIPSFKGTETLIKRGNGHSQPRCVNYRGEGWPGDFRVEYEDGTIYKCDYNRSWGEVLGRTLNFRCKICPDGMGTDADIVVGDSWHTKNGYPDFTESEGKSFVLVRTENGKQLIRMASMNDFLKISEFDISKLKIMHQYQYQRLQSSFYKLLAAWVCTLGLIKIRGLHQPKLSLLKGLRIMYGTIIRF